MNRRIPVSVITGFLGSGKTTVLNHLLQQPAFHDAAVLVNELGEIAIDHLLVRDVDENILRLANGCLCCAMRGDMVNTLRDLHVKRASGQVPAFHRMLIETTGLADPAPVLHTLMRDPLIAEHFRLDGVIATVDAVNGINQLDRQPENVKQVAVADRLLLTKTDLADTETVRTLRQRLRHINPPAPIHVVSHGHIDPAHLLNAGLFNPATKSVDVRRWLNAESYIEVLPEVSTDGGVETTKKYHTDNVRTFCLRWDTPIQWQPFADALQALIDQHGQKVLRVKGILNVEHEATPVVIHGVQHIFHPPILLPAWPDVDRRSRLVVITRDLEEGIVRCALDGVIPRLIALRDAVIDKAAL